MFCPECGSLMYPHDQGMKCRKCGFISTKQASKRIVSAREDREVTVIDEKVSVLPKTNVACPECNHNEAYWILRQTRAADEPETRIYTCTKCGYKWREY